MTVLVDTPVWSLAYRRQRLAPAEENVVAALRKLVQNHQAMMVGSIRQEVLSGLRDGQKWDLLRETLRAFEDLPLSTDDYESAAQFFNRCHTAGIQGSQTDFLLCAVAARFDAPIFTTDHDFTLYAKHIKIRLYGPRAG